MPRLPKQDTELLEAALIGFLQQRDQIEQKIAEIRSRIGGRATSQAASTAASNESAHTKRTMSAAHGAASLQPKGRDGQLTKRSTERRLRLRLKNEYLVPPAGPGSSPPRKNDGQLTGRLRGPVSQDGRAQAVDAGTAGTRCL